MKIHERPADIASPPHRTGRDGRTGGGPSPRTNGGAVPGTESARARWAWLAGLAGVLTLAVLLRLPGLDTPVGGFHAFNEAHYILIAQNALHGWILHPTADQGGIFLENPPLLPYLLALAFSVGGPSVLVARIVALVISVLLVGAVALLGRDLFGAEAGLLAGALMATAPVAVLAGRNVQTDSLYLLLVTLAMLFYHRAEQARPVANRLVAGALFGLAIFSKLFAAVAVVAVVVWDCLTHRAGALRDRWRWVAAALVLFPAGPFFAYHALRDYEHFVDNVFHGAAAVTTVPTSVAGWLGLIHEAWWAYSPLVFVLVLAGAVVALAWPGRTTLYLLLPFGCYAGFYVYAHKHSYYLLALLPFGALLAAAAVGRLPWRAARVALVGVACVSAAFVTLVDYGSMKLGYREFAEAGERLNGGEGLQIVLDPDVTGNAYPVALLYLPRAQIYLSRDLDSGALATAGPLRRLRYVAPNEVATADTLLFSRDRRALQLFGWRIVEDHANPHFFQQGRYHFERIGGWLDFGFPVVGTYPEIGLSVIR